MTSRRPVSATTRSRGSHSAEASSTKALYEFASRVGRRFDATHLVDVDCGDGRHLAGLPSTLEIVGLDVPERIEECRRLHDFGDWRAVPSGSRVTLPANIIHAAAVVWRARHTVSSHEFEERLASLRPLFASAPISILALPLRTWRDDQTDEPTTSLHALRRALEAETLGPEFLGFSPVPPATPVWAVAVVAANAPPSRPAPPEFCVTAIVTAFNEHDIIRPTVEQLLHDGIDVHLIDNWSTDGTPEQVQMLAERGLISIERFPPGGPPTGYEWAKLLEKVQQVATTLDAHWCIHHDADERRDSPWPSIGLKDAIYRVDRWGFNAIDHTLLEFRPTDDDYTSGTEVSEYFRMFEFVPASAHAAHVQAWKNDHPVDLVTSGGHDVAFADRRVFPFNFLLRHYPIRSQSHGERKVFTERRPRYPAEELDQGWHYHYLRLRRNHRFVRDPRDLIEFVNGEFEQQYLLPRLARVDVPLRAPTRREQLRSAGVRTLRRAGLLSAYLGLRRRFRQALAARVQSKG